LEINFLKLYQYRANISAASVLIVHRAFINNEWSAIYQRSRSMIWSTIPLFAPYSHGAKQFLTMEFSEFLKYSCGKWNPPRAYSRCVCSRPTCCRATVHMLHGRRGLCFVGSLSDRNHPYLLLDFDHYLLRLTINPSHGGHEITKFETQTLFPR